MKLTTNQKVFVLVVVLINVVLWLVSSDVVEAIARDRQTLLGRYSRRHFTWIIALLPISVGAIYIHLSATAAIKKKKAFRIVAILAAVFGPLFVADVYLRVTKDWPYVLDKLAYRRPPNTTFDAVYEDVPEAYRTYPNAPPGFGKVVCNLTTDKRGYRNLTDGDQYDVVALGDSFTEGSKVADDDPWPVRFAGQAGVSVYNLGMSGYAPQHYLASLKEYALPLKPKAVMCMIYEGNDFRSARQQTELPPEWSRFFKRSPIIEAIDEFLIRTLGPIGAHGEVKGVEMLSWQPIAVPVGPDAGHYAFPPRALGHLYVSRADFEEGKRWRRTVLNLDEIQRLCKASGTQLVIVYAPTKPHVVMPLVRDALPVEKVHAFVAMRVKFRLPDPKEFYDNLFQYLGTKEAVTQAWCEKNDVPFISLTAPLQEAALAGKQVYYTYNEHWTPIGHQIVGDAVARFWMDHQSQNIAAPAGS